MLASMQVGNGEFIFNLLVQLFYFSQPAKLSVLIVKLEALINGCTHSKEVHSI